jgi:hypothetical protein
MGEKSNLNPKPLDPKPTNIRPEPAPLPSLDKPHAVTNLSYELHSRGLATLSTDALDRGPQCKIFIKQKEQQQL